MTKSVPDKAEVAVEYPDKLYIGTFERTARFDAHLDEAGISLSLYRTGADDVRKSVRMHFHYALFAEILQDLAKTVAALPATDVTHREALRDAAKTLYLALACGGSNDNPNRTPDEEMRLLHILEYLRVYVDQGGGC
jgi:hypothetical protein